MVLLALLAVALVAVVVGIVLASVTWLIVSLVASVLAAVVLYRSWARIKERRTNMAWRRKSGPDAAASVPAATAGPGEVLVVDGRPHYHRTGCADLAGRSAEAVPLAQAAEDGFTPCPTCAPEPAPPAGSPGDVWVVDGSPEYHERGCAALTGRPGEPIPPAQAVEDGFRPCPICKPASAAAAAASPETGAAPDEAGAAQVWVADGHPEYHVQGCAELSGLPGEPVPYAQALEDGFQPCVVCNPDRELGDAAGSVWVVDGRPAYHRPDCAQLSGLPAEPIPRAQAVEDGFTPCPACEPDSAEHEPAPGEGTPEVAGPAEAVASPAAAPAGAEPGAEPGAALDQRDVWVVDGYPNFHAAGCPELDGLDSEPVPYRQAVEDGFAPCPACTPDAVTGQVWVVDGFPDYHRAGCRELAGLDAEPVPHGQAVEDGFAACTVCRPDDAEAEPEPQPEPRPEAAAAPVGVDGSSAAPADVAAADLDAQPEPAADTQPETAPEAASSAGRMVWVVGGRPRYHEQDCLIIKGQPAQRVPYDAAVGDGFLPCSLCQRGH